MAAARLQLFAFGSESGGGRDRNILNKERKEKNHLLIIIDDKREMQHIDTDR